MKQNTSIFPVMLLGLFVTSSFVYADVPPFKHLRTPKIVFKEKAPEKLTLEKKKKLKDKTAKKVNKNKKAIKQKKVIKSTTMNGNSTFGAICKSNKECAAPTNLCVIQPGFSEGYCSIVCATNSDCVKSGWTCNALGECKTPIAIWCGPAEEVGGSLKMCK